jgi:hypothetical protein
MNRQTDPQQQPPPPPNPPGVLAHKPARAAICAIIPGVGAVYNREYVKAIVQFTVFAGLTIISESVSIFGLAAFAFYVFTIIDAYRSAEAIARRETSDPLMGAQEAGGLNLLLWGGLLIGMGVLFLLDNLGAIRLRDAVQFWPILLIGLGVYLIISQFTTRKKESPSPRVSDSDQEG